MLPAISISISWIRRALLGAYAVYLKVKDWKGWVWIWTWTTPRSLQTFLLMGWNVTVHALCAALGRWWLPQYRPLHRSTTTRWTPWSKRIAPRRLRHITDGIRALSRSMYPNYAARLQPCRDRTQSWGQPIRSLRYETARQNFWNSMLRSMQLS